MHDLQLRLFDTGAASPALSGDPGLCELLADLIAMGFPDVTEADVPSVEVRWNSRLRTTVGRVTFPDAGRPGLPPHPVIELAPRYHDAYPDELPETLVHEFAHVVTPGCGHGPPWKRVLAAALERLGLEVRDGLRFARNPAPQAGERYTWICSACGSTLGHRSRRRSDEVAAESGCCHARVVVLDRKGGGLPVTPRSFVVVCSPCATQFRAYDDAGAAARFARGHICGRCGTRLGISTAIDSSVRRVRSPAAQVD